MDQLTEDDSAIPPMPPPIKGRKNPIPPQAQMIQLNRRQELDIEEMCAQIPEIPLAMGATRGWAFCHPFTVKWPAMKQVNGEEFKYIIRKYYGDHRWETYLRKKKYGIMAWKPRWVEGHWVPFIPMIGSGNIWQYMDGDKMEYVWFWANRPGITKPDLNMRFVVWHAPDYYGNYTSPFVTALRVWGMSKVVSLSASRAVFHASHIPQFLVHKPPKGRPGDEKIDITWGDEEEIEIERDKHNRSLERGQMSRNALRGAIDTAQARNQGRDPFAATLAHRSPVLNSESISEREKREGNGTLDRLIELDSYWDLASPTAPVLLADPLLYDKRLGQVVAALVDLPLSMVIDQHAQHAGNFDAQITFARDRMKAEMADMSDHLTDVILDLERDYLYDIYVKAARWASGAARRPLTEQELIEIHASAHGLVVEQTCTPLAVPENFIQLWEYGVFDQKTLAEEMCHHFGIPVSKIKVTPLKRQRELEMAQQSLAEKTANDQSEQGAKKLAIEEKSAKSNAELGTKKLELDAKNASASAAKKAKTSSKK